MKHVPKKIIQNVLNLSALTCKFARIKRQSFHDDGKTVETDSDHTLSLSILACSLAEVIRPDLDRGKIAQYCIVHDLVEVYAGDTPTLKKLSLKQKAKKDQAEKEALERIRLEFADSFPWIHKTIVAYESLNDAEARFVKVMDKAQPKALAILNGAITIFQANMETSAKSRFEQQIKEATESYGSDQPEAVQILTELINKMLRTVEINRK